MRACLFHWNPNVSVYFSDGTNRGIPSRTGYLSPKGETNEPSRISSPSRSEISNSTLFPDVGQTRYSSKCFFMPRPLYTQNLSSLPSAHGLMILPMFKGSG